MDLACYLCSKKFKELSEAFKHLKKIHFVTENCDKLICLVPNCNREYNTFNALRTHVKKCLNGAPIRTKCSEIEVKYHRINCIPQFCDFSF